MYKMFWNFTTYNSAVYMNEIPGEKEVRTGSLYPASPTRNEKGKNNPGRFSPSRLRGRNESLSPTNSPGSLVGHVS